MTEKRHGPLERRAHFFLSKSCFRGFVERSHRGEVKVPEDRSWAEGLSGGVGHLLAQPSVFLAVTECCKSWILKNVLKFRRVLP